MAGTIVCDNITNGSAQTGSTTDMIKGSARAWVNFNGTGTVAIRASYNVSSITDLGTGQYQVNFTTAMPDTNYATVTDAKYNTTNNYPSLISGLRREASSADYIGINCGSTTTFYDMDTVTVVVFR